MNVRCQVQKLRESFQLASSVVNARSPKPILANVKFVASDKGLEILSTDLEVAIRCRIEEVEVVKQGMALVNAARLGSILRECDDEKINLETTEYITTVSYTNAEYKLQGGDPDEFPIVTEFEAEGAVELDKADLRKMIRYTSFAASRDTTSFALNGLYLVLRPNEIRLVGADRHRLAYIKKKASNPDKTKAEVIVPTKAMEQLERMMTDDDKVVGVKVMEKQIVFSVKRGTIAAHLVEGKYPDYEGVVPKDCDNKVDINSQLLLHSVRKAVPIAPEESKSVTIKLEPGKLTISSTASEVGSAQIDVPIEYDGKTVMAAFNPDFLTDLLKVVEEETARLELKDSDSPGLMRIGREYVCVIMPMQIEE